MSKKKVLVPVDGSDRSLVSLEYVKDNFKPEDVEVTIMHVREIVFVNGMAVSEEVRDGEMLGKRVLEEAKKKLPGFNVKTEFTFGSPGDEIVNYTQEDGTDIIVMGKNTNKKFSFLVGSVTAYVVKRVKCIVIMIPEEF
ncbi:universal stress protein [Clostridium chrysemydis]|uniref:universal stress protein n=3 Tax=Clostridium TaxID=1485 RepID=UPI0018846B6C|nr:universal stress protein [Clostridium chrysemydis]